MCHNTSEIGWILFVCSVWALRQPSKYRKLASLPVSNELHLRSSSKNLAAFSQSIPKTACRNSRSGEPYPARRLASLAWRVDTPQALARVRDECLACAARAPAEPRETWLNSASGFEVLPLRGRRELPPPSYLWHVWRGSIGQGSVSFLTSLFAMNCAWASNIA